MRRSVIAVLVTTVACVAVAAPMAAPAPARANLLSTGCGLLGTFGEGWMGSVCNAATHPGKLLGVVKGVAGDAARNLASARGALGIAAIVAWAVGGAHYVLSETAKLVGQSTGPELTAAWFSSVYWRVAAVAAMLTVPFLCAAALQAILRADLPLLARATFGYLPVAFLATGIAAPLAMLLLAVTDWMGAAVAAAAGEQGGHFLTLAGVSLGGLGVLVGSPFVTFLVALLTAAGGLILWLELLIREAAVYVVVLMLPLVFCAIVWPARRLWAVRAVEVLMALILSKFAIVSVLALAAAALGHGGGDLVVKALAGLVLVVLGAFAPWVLLRLLPLAEVAAAAVGHVRGAAQARLAGDARLGARGATAVGDGTSSLISRMRAFSIDATDAARATAAETGADGAAVDATALSTIGHLRPTSSVAPSGPSTPPVSTGGQPAPGGDTPTAALPAAAGAPDTSASAPSPTREAGRRAAEVSDPPGAEPVDRPAVLDEQPRPTLPPVDLDEPHE